MQTIKYKWTTNNSTLEPSLFFLDNGIRKFDIMNKHISMSVGERRCIGHFSNGKHVPCPDNRLLDSGYNCNECKLNDDFFMCMKCDGSVCMNEKLRNNCIENKFFVYLAAFDSVIKVGISQQFRLIERLIEQGADFGAKIAAVKDGKEVRVIEQEISSYLNIVDRLTGDQKHKLLFGNPNKSIQMLVSSINSLKNNGVSKYMVPTEIYDLRSYYKLDSVSFEPRKIKMGDNVNIQGDVVAAKGNIVILKTDSGFQSFNAHDLIGRHVELENYN
ncbi:DUF2797 domain-containing protein [archaeon]|nr:DUF2797 domain-containing protein [archaeon]